MSEVAQSGLGSGTLAGDLVRAVPTVAVTAPSGPQATETVTVTWTYSSVAGKPQTKFRVRVLDQFGVTPLFDSGFIEGAGTSYACPFLLSSGSAYRVEVSASDGVDAGVGSSAFSSNLAGLADFVPLEDVGSVFEVAINGVGYRLADTPQRPYTRSTGQLQAPRLATGDTPFSEAVERYTFTGTGDWSFGAGQRVGDRDGADPRRFWDSENVNPFEPGEVSLLPATEELTASAAGAVGAVVASGHLFCATGTDTVERLTAPDATPDVMTFTGDTLVDLVSDGTYWYALNTDDEIFRGIDTTIGSAWANLATPAAGASIIEWCSDRLAVVYENPAGLSVLSTLAPDGTEEVADGRFKFTDATITAVTAGDGYLWFSVNRDDRSAVYAWQLGSADGAFIALEVPKGESVTELFFYLGNVFVRAERPTGGTVYRAIPSNGELVPERVLEMSGAGTGAGGFSGQGRFVFFGWGAMSTDGRSGVGAIDLSTGGWCRWLQAATAADTGAVGSVFSWLDEVGFLVDGSGPQYTSDTLSVSGFVTSSVRDLGSSLVKVVDSVSIGMSPLPASSSVDVQLSYDSGISFQSAGSVSSPGVRAGTWEVGRESSSTAVKLVLSTTGSLSPKVTMSQVKLHPLSLVDALVELPIDCSDRMSGLNGVEIVDSRGGLERARQLEGLVGTRVVLQDVDWPSTRVVETWEVVAAEYSSVGVFERHKGSRQEAAAVCLVRLRRAR